MGILEYVFIFLSEDLMWFIQRWIIDYHEGVHKKVNYVLNALYVKKDI